MTDTGSDSRDSAITPETVTLHNRKPVLDAARLLERQNSPHEALALYLAAAGRWPGQCGLKLSVARMAKATGDNAMALKWLLDARQRRPDDPNIALLVFNAQVRLNQDEDALTSIGGALQQFPDDAKIRSAHARAQISMAGKDPPADFDLEAELNNPKADQRLLRSILLARKPLQSRARYADTLGRFAQVFPGDDNRRIHAMALYQAHRYGEAVAALDALVTQRPILSDSLIRAIHCAEQDQTEAAQTHLDTYVSGQDDAHAILKAATEFAGNMQDLQVAGAVLSRLNARRRDPGIARLLNFLGAIRSPRRGLIDDTTADEGIILSPAGDSGAAVLAFAGYARRTGFLPLSLIDRFFAGHGVAVAQLSDRSGHLFWNGVDTLGQTRAQTQASLRARLEAMGVRRIYTLGTSGGGVGAMIYGAELGARRILSFSGPSDLTQSFIDSYGDKRARAVIKFLNAKLGADRLNIRARLERFDPLPPIHQYFCQSETRDETQAQNLAHLPQVQLHPVAGYDQHDSICAALGTGQLLTAFEAIVEDMPNA